MERVWTKKSIRIRNHVLKRTPTIRTIEACFKRLERYFGIIFSIRTNCEERGAMRTDEQIWRITVIRNCIIDGNQLAAFTLRYVLPATNRNFFSWLN